MNVRIVRVQGRHPSSKTEKELYYTNMFLGLKNTYFLLKKINRTIDISCVLCAIHKGI